MAFFNVSCAFLHAKWVKKIFFATVSIYYPYSLNCEEALMSFVLTVRQTGSDVCYFGELDDIYYFVHRSGLIEAYKLENKDQDGCLLKPYYEIQLTEQYSPSGFTTSKANNCLYIGNRSKLCVHRLDLRTDDRQEQVTGFVKMKNDNERPQSLSAISDGRLVIMVAIEDSFSRSWHGRLDIYDKSAILQTTVNMPQLVGNPWCVTYSGQNTFTFTYGLFQFGVMRLNNQGKIIGHCNEGLSMPRSLKYMEGCSCVYVLDSGRRMLLQLDMELKLQRALYHWNSKDDKQPMRITFNTEKTHAIVGKQGGQVDLYKINWTI